MTTEPDLLKQYGKLVKRCQVVEKISDVQIRLPKDENTFDEIMQIHFENLTKFRKFTRTVVNPATIAELIDSVSAVSIKHLRDRTVNDMQMHYNI